MKNKKVILKFILIFFISFIVTELLEYTLNQFFLFDFKMMTFGWFGLMVFYGFKYHIICCLFPAIWVGYKCRHKSCEHEYCHDEEK
jgi:hypothetical protein